ncbi:unnamed protein product [Aphanomyces euteiches]|uniref:Phosphatidate cytidylyltransferase, mitochondrial n=1 Tax=Aphanomyces euteiches TaxID=100861 RepID=A0A6G0XJ12_9STRA|nr:hypothetical protein Ae201684_004279 [Aphanomyces euteiches]KAH9093679.1 hypothetical protein Ae201684P_016304 [Aphanomyces euteiches]
MASLATLLPHFPPVDFAMGYGSAVFKQDSHDNSNSMIDLVLAVEDPLAWHTEQMERHPQHYSGIKYFGPRAVVYVQEKLGAGCYYNTLVQIPGSTQLMKYGVVKTSTLCKDLTEWTTLYLSGRMHKPVNMFKSIPSVDAAASVNLSHAMHLAILGLPESFTEEQLFTKIAGISYLGDFRMIFGENPKKVRNIVKGSMASFQQLYEKKISNSPFLSRLQDGMLQSDVSPIAREAMFNGLPHNITSRLSEKSKAHIILHPKNGGKLKFAVSSVVGKFSRTQSIKGIATAGGMKTLVYVWQKLSRTYLGKK